MANKLENGFQVCPTPNLEDQDPGSWASLILDSASLKVMAVINYYSSKRNTKKFWGRTVQAIIIGSAFGTGVIPLLPALIEDPDSRFVISPVWASISVLLAGVALAVDRYYGFRSASVRFLAAERKLQTLIDDFQYERLILEISQENSPDQKELARHATILARQMIGNMNEIVNLETEDWQKEIKQVIIDSLIER